MTSFRYKKRLSPILILVVSLLFVGASGIATNPADPLVLRAEKLPIQPKEFYIAELVDERKDKKAVAYLLPIGGTGKPQAIDLQGGGQSALRDFMQQSLPTNKKLRPVVIRLKEFQVKETAAGTGRVAGQVSVVMDFETQREGENIPLFSYKGGGRYERPASKNEVTEPALRQSLVESLRYLNTWMDREANTNPRLARGIKVSFTDYTASSDLDTVFYNPRRPLNWQDFQANVNRSSRFAATVFPSFAYDGDSKVIDGIIHLNLTMKVYVLKSSSWVKDSAKNPYSLNHEQRHFDIVKVVAERFKDKIKAADLSLNDYDSNVQYHFIESFREMNKLQEQYDGETNHGLDKAAQERWNQTLDAQLNAIGAK